MPVSSGGANIGPYSQASTDQALLNERPVVDGFSYSLSRIPNAVSYYQNSVAQMEVLRRANGYRTRIYNVPVQYDEPVAAYSTIEYQVRTQPGAYLWGLLFECAPIMVSGVTTQTYNDILIQITDACTETHLFSDFVLGGAFAETTAGVGLNRPPVLLPNPLLVGPPGHLDVEISNRATVIADGASSESRTCQLLLFMAEPSLPMIETAKLLRAAGFKL